MSIENTENINISNEAKNPKRKAVEDMIISYIGRIVTGEDNKQLYIDLFKSMSDSDFDKFMVDLRDGNKTLSVIIPNNDSKYKVDVENNIKLAKELGFNMFQKLKVGKTKDVPEYITPNEYLILKLPVRRAAQLLIKKISIPTDNKHIDMLSGQVTGKSKGSKITNPELQVLTSIGLEKTLIELLKVRGGDLGAGAAAEGMLIKHGSVGQDTLNLYSTGVVSKETLKAYFYGMHIKNNL